MVGWGSESSVSVLMEDTGDGGRNVWMSWSGRGVAILGGSYGNEWRREKVALMVGWRRVRRRVSV